MSSMYELLSEMFSYNRSITGDGVRKTLNRISDEKVDDIAKLININRHLIISYRTLLLKEKIIFNHGKIKSKINNVLSDYDNNILELSKKYDSSPISILRLILKKKYPNMKSIKNSIDLFNETDKKQLQIAEENDYISPLNEDNIQKKSEEYEEKIAHFLDNKEIKYKTQETLIKEQTDEKGYAYATPDFLLNEPMMINDNIINWIEVKNFYGSNIKFMNKKIQKQVNKYYKIWGLGCLVFRYGVYENLKLDNCYILAFSSKVI